MEHLPPPVVVGYGLLLLSMGGYFVHRQGTPAGFFLGGRSLSAFRVFGTTFSTFLGTGLVFTLAAVGYRFGAGAFFLPGAGVVGLLLLATAAPRLKSMSDREDAVTLPALMERHWDDRTQSLAAIVTASLFAGTLAANLLVVGDVLQVFLGVRPAVGIGVFSGLVVAHAVLGGFRAVAWSDVVQLVLIVASIAVVLPLLAMAAAGPGVHSTLPDGHLDPFALPVPILAVYLLVGGFAFFGSQDLFQRVYAARDATAARRGLLAFTGGFVVVGTAAIALGILARALLPDAAPDRALLLVADAVTPGGLLGVVVVGLLALANSDADSQLLTVASTVTQDLAPAGNWSDGRRRMVAARATVVAIGTAAGLVALVAPGLIELAGALGSWFAILGFVVVASLYWDRTTDAAASWGLTVGFLAPAVFVLATGNVQAAPVVGLVATAGVVGAISLLGGADG